MPKKIQYPDGREAVEITTTDFDSVLYKLAFKNYLLLEVVRLQMRVDTLEAKVELGELQREQLNAAYVELDQAADKYARVVQQNAFDRKKDERRIEKLENRRGRWRLFAGAALVYGAVRTFLWDDIAPFLKDLLNG